MVSRSSRWSRRNAPRPYRLGKSMNDIAYAVTPGDWRRESFPGEISKHDGSLEERLQLAQRSLGDRRRVSQLSRSASPKTLRNVRGNRQGSTAKLRRHAVELGCRQIWSESIDLGEKAHAFAPHDEISVASRCGALTFPLFRCAHEIALIPLPATGAIKPTRPFLDYLDTLDDLDTL